jgi:uncharacterized protein YifN (PemK superfamily)
MCDFHGLNVPEMVKKREVVIVSRNKNPRLVTVVPLSTTAPQRLEPFHFELSKNPRPNSPSVRVWAKADMLYTLSIDRMEMHEVRSRRNTQKLKIQVSEQDFEGIRKAVVYALNLRHNSIVSS